MQDNYAAGTEVPLRNHKFNDAEGIREELGDLKVRVNCVAPMLAQRNL